MCRSVNVNHGLFDSDTAPRTERSTDFAVLTKRLGGALSQRGAGKHDQDLRDTAVTWLARAKATLPEIAAITGHSLKSIHDIMKHYLAITPELGDAGIRKFTAWMEREGIAVEA